MPFGKAQAYREKTKISELLSFLNSFLFKGICLCFLKLVVLLIINVIYTTSVSQKQVTRYFPIFVKYQ